MSNTKNKKYTFASNNIVIFRDVEDVLNHFTQIGIRHHAKYGRWEINDIDLWHGADSLSHEHNGAVGSWFLQLMHNVAPEFSIDYFTHKDKPVKNKDNGYSMHEWNENLLKQPKFAVRDWQIHGDRSCPHNYFFWKTLMYFFDVLERYGLDLKNPNQKLSKISGQLFLDQIDKWYDKMCDQEQKNFPFLKEHFDKEEADNGSN